MQAYAKGLWEKAMAEFEEEYEDVLQNIEFGIMNVYRDNPQLADHSVMRVLESLVDDYRGEKIGRGPRQVNFSDLEIFLKASVQTMCDWRLGRRDPDESPGVSDGEGPKPITVDELILCLKRVHKSAKFWNKEGGSQGYLNFIAGYV